MKPEKEAIIGNYVGALDALMEDFPVPVDLLGTDEELEVHSSEAIETWLNQVKTVLKQINDLL